MATKVETAILNTDEVRKYLTQGLLAARGMDNPSAYMAKRTALVTWKNINGGLIAAVTIVDEPEAQTPESE